jgi:hypothetical protein
MAKGIKRVVHGGNLTDFVTFLMKHQENSSNFQVTSKGSSRIVEFESGIKYRFFGHGKTKSSRIEGAYFATMLKNSVDKYIDRYGIIEKRDGIISQVFNVKGIEESVGKPICCLDLNLCYWRTAYLLGYIDRKLYDKGIESGHKRGMLVSIGSLNTLPIIEKYENGSMISQTADSELNARYSPFYWAIIGKVYDLCMEVYKVIGDDLYMWLTDCAFISIEKQNEVIEVFEKFGFPYKTYTSDFTYCDGTTVEWYDCKESKLKTISIGGRHISPLYRKWKYSHKFYEQDTILEQQNDE